MYMYTQIHTHTHSLIKDQMTPWLPHVQRESFASPKLELNHLLVFLSTSVPPMHKHTALPGYLQCHYIQTLPEHSCPEPRGLLLSRTERKGALGARAGGSQLCTGGSSAHDGLTASRHGTSGPYASFKAHLAPGEAGASRSSLDPCSETHQRTQVSSDGGRTQQQARGTLHDSRSSDCQQ